ncbi:tetratricopeptide repeat protein [Aerosakkonema sp. BLCC-F183]|uniref:tetratricopeptide repeat protein n=1 Tax=Aerosakkonema sp. BLCC-F183 TaxID=3342834 RepID=UPI0035B94568
MPRKNYASIQLLLATMAGIGLSSPVFALPAQDLGNSGRFHAFVAIGFENNHNTSAAEKPSEQLKQAETLYNEGVTLQQQGKLEEAIAKYQEAIRLNPSLAFAHLNLGAALAGLGKQPEAISAYREAILLQPNLAEAYYNLGNALAQQGELPDAQAQYKQAIQINPTYAKAYYNLGNVLAQQGDRDGAIAQWREAIRIQPEFAEAYANLGLIFSRSGQRREALEAFKRARDLFKSQGKTDRAEQIDRIIQRVGTNRTVITRSLLGSEYSTAISSEA